MSLLSQQLAAAAAADTERGRGADREKTSAQTLGSIIVYGAASGAMVEIEGLSERDTVGMLQEHLSRPVSQGGLGVGVSNQILLCTEDGIRASRNANSNSDGVQQQAPKSNRESSDGDKSSIEVTSQTDSSSSSSAPAPSSTSAPSQSSWMHVPEATLKSFRLPSKSLSVLLYDRRLLSRRSATPADISISASCVSIPQELATINDILAAYASENHDHDRSYVPANSMKSDVTSASLQAIMLQFELNLRQAHAYRTNGMARFRACAESVFRQKVQLYALDVSTRNLQELMDAKRSEFKKLWSRKSLLMQSHEHELSSFSGNLNVLKRIPLHKVLRQSSQGAGSIRSSGNDAVKANQRTSLWDCVPVAKLEAWADDCRERHASLLNGPAPALQHVFDEVSGAVNNLVGKANHPSGDLHKQQVAIEDLESMLSSYAPLYEDSDSSTDGSDEVSAVLHLFKADFEWIRGAVLKLDKTAVNASNLAKQAIDRGEVHVGKLQMLMNMSGDKVSTIDNVIDSSWKSPGIKTLDEILLQSIQSENRCRKMFHVHLRAVSELQYRIAKSLSEKMVAFDQALNAQEKNIDYLVDVKNVPRVYVAFLCEVARRRANTHVLRKELRDASTKLNRLREQEMQHRETFIRRHGRAVVADLVPAIANVRPMSIDIRERASNSDESLPDIGLDEDTIEIYENLGEKFASIIRDVRGDAMERSFENLTGVNKANAECDVREIDSNDNLKSRCIELEFQNALLKASIISDSVGHGETPLSKLDDSAAEAVDAAAALKFFPTLYSRLQTSIQKQTELESRVKELEQGDNENLHAKIQELNDKLEKQGLVLQSEQAESERLRMQVRKFRRKAEKLSTSVSQNSSTSNESDARKEAH